MNPARLRTALIVLLAAQHNPAIMSPQWLREKGLITEEATQFVNTSEFSVFESETFLVLVDRQRLQITAKKQDRDALERLQHIGAGYLREQPHTPYRALGINFEWVLEAAVGEDHSVISVNIRDVGDLSSVLAEHQLSYGFTIHAEKPPYRLRLLVEPEGRSTLAFKFNYHHELGEADAEGIAKHIETLMSLREHSQMVAEAVSVGRGQASG